MSTSQASGHFSPMLRWFMKQATRPWWLALVLGLWWMNPAQAVEIRVAIKKGVSQVKVGSSTPANIRDASGRTVGQISPMDATIARASRGTINVGSSRSSQLFIEPQGDGYVWIGDRWYRGRVRLLRHSQGMMAINHVDIEHYLYSVVGAEAYASWPLEALKTQAVAARTYALHKSSKSGNQYFDLDTTTATQVYKGLDSEYQSTHEAVNSTAGQVMTYGGQVILAVFHSSSGGHTENVEDIWSSALPYLRGVVDYDQLSPVFQWSKAYSASQLGRILGVGTLTAMSPERITPRGRVVSMRVAGTGGSKSISGDRLRNVLGLRSTLFNVSNLGGSFQVYGRGYGHGVGLSQWGAHYLAEQGISYTQILTHYYQNAALAELQ